MNFTVYLEELEKIGATGAAADDFLNLTRNLIRRGPRRADPTDIVGASAVRRARPKLRRPGRSARLRADLAEEARQTALTRGMQPSLSVPYTPTAPTPAMEAALNRPIPGAAERRIARDLAADSAAAGQPFRGGRGVPQSTPDLEAALNRPSPSRRADVARQMEESAARGQIARDMAADARASGQPFVGGGGVPDGGGDAGIMAALDRPIQRGPVATPGAAPEVPVAAAGAAPDGPIARPGAAPDTPVRGEPAVGTPSAVPTAEPAVSAPTEVSPEVQEAIARELAQRGLAAQRSQQLAASVPPPLPAAPPTPAAGPSPMSPEQAALDMAEARALRARRGRGRGGTRGRQQARQARQQQVRQQAAQPAAPAMEAPPAQDAGGMLGINPSAEAAGPAGPVSVPGPAAGVPAPSAAPPAPAGAPEDVSQMVNRARAERAAQVRSGRNPNIEAEIVEPTVRPNVSQEAVQDLRGTPESAAALPPGVEPPSPEAVQAAKASDGLTGDAAEQAAAAAGGGGGMQQQTQQQPPQQGLQQRWDALTPGQKMMYGSMAAAPLVAAGGAGLGYLAGNMGQPGPMPGAPQMLGGNPNMPVPGGPPGMYPPQMVTR